MSDRFIDGPSPLPADAALAWLERAGSKTLRLPVRIHRDPLGVRATLGAGEGAAALALDSGALSRTLDTHLAEHCDDADPCDVWLEGTWGPLVPNPLAPPGPTFAVRAVVGKVEDIARATMKIAP